MSVRFALPPLIHQPRFTVHRFYTVAYTHLKNGQTALDDGSTMKIHAQATASANHAFSAPMLADAGSSRLYNSTEPVDRTAASAFQVPGHAIHLFEPQRLAVLSIGIDATTTITTSRAASSQQRLLSFVQLPFPHQPASPSVHSFHPQSPNVYRHASTSKLYSPQPPPSSFPKSSRSRPLSHDFGQKARDALNEFGRLATRRTSAIERVNGADTIARVADGLNINSAYPHTTHAQGASLQSLPLQQRAPPQSSAHADNTSHLHFASDDAVMVRSRATRRFTMLPQRDPPFASHTLPLGIECRITTSDSTSSKPVPVEFITEPVMAANGLDKRVASASSCASFDPTRLMLKVHPPAELARQSWSHAASFLTSHNASQYDSTEDHAVKFRFRLRLCGSSTTSTSPFFPPERNSTATAVPKQGLGQVLFLSAASPDKLASAIESPESCISTSELASLEGISRVEVVPFGDTVSTAVARGPRDCDFDWTWKSLTRSSLSDGSRCCCAFVEMCPDGKAATLLAAMSVYIELPPPAATHSRLLFSATGLNASKEVISGSDSLALFAALNLDNDLSPPIETTPPTSTSCAVSGAVDISPNPTQLRSPKNGNPLPLLIDRTELTLEDLVNDSPIFRAAVVNLERRTVSMKKASKTVLRAAQETRTRIIRLIEAEDAFDAAFEGLIAMAPESLGQLQDQYLRQARVRITQHRREQANTIETCLERPLIQITELCRVVQEGFKLFENESKAYYSQTQKWLANRSNADVPPFHSASNDALSALAHEKVQKQERTDEKQKLRELRFEQARLDLFVMLQRLHGGRAEAHLAQSILQLSQWLADLPNTFSGPNWRGQEQKSCLSALDSGLRVALDDHALQLEQVEARSRRLGDKIRLLEHAPGKTADADAYIVGAHRFEMEQEAPQLPHTSGAVASKARKFRSFLGAFAASINNSPLISSKGTSPNPDATEFHKQAEVFVVNGSDQSQKVDARHSLSLKLKNDRGQPVDPSASSPSKSQAPSSWRYVDPPAISHRGSELQDSNRLRNDEPPKLVAAGWRASLSATRSASDANSSAVSGHECADTRDTDRGLGISAPASPTSAQVMNRGAVSGAPFSSSSPSPTRGAERKKEGVLWVMSKPITGPAGADAPRGVNRAAHWRECWVVLSGSGQISEFADWKNAKALEPTNPLIDLRFATVREARGVDRRFAFEVVTRNSRRFFQAPDEDSMRDWMRAISKAIESLLNGTSSVRKLDRAVRASRFRNLDSAQRAGVFEEHDEELGAGEGNDFVVRRLLDRPGKTSSQSMMDLSASAKAQAGVRKDQQKLSGHLATLSESHAESSVRSSKRKSRHERGISNKTPISGYLGAGGLGLSAADATALHAREGAGISDDASISSMSANGEHDTEFDRQIEEVIHRNYGPHDDTGTRHSGFLRNSASHGVDEMGKLKGIGPASSSPTRGTLSTISSKGRSAVNGSMANTAASTKLSRSAEVAAISRQAENQHCADCQENDPRWASWMLANEPCCIFICIGCSGVHRSLGVHISKVKSVDLDDWTEEQVQSARDWGNARANALWEHSKPAGLLPSLGDRKEFWRNKYVEQKWKVQNVLPEVARDQGTPSAQLCRTDRAEDVDATPTRRSMLDASTPERKGQDHARTIDFGITPEDQLEVWNDPGKLAEGLGSPRPNGPRPLPNRRSVSMQSVPTSSPPQSPIGPAQLYSINHGLRSPMSPSRCDRVDWSVEQPHRTRLSEDRTESTTRSAVPLIATDESLHEWPANDLTAAISASVPHLSSIAASSSNPHVSQAMLAARADPRLFPSTLLAPIDTKPARIASPPSSYFVSNLDGPSPSPIFFNGSERGVESGLATGSARSVDEEATSANRPARFEPFVLSS
uniref:ArfGap-domain-containing protein n=1 Tax=Ustilago esculenta TaxID=185366 RepID=A0A481SH95_9BASI|nr:hypothetical protein UE_1413 [Ustilago esculenta]